MLDKHKNFLKKALDIALVSIDEGGGPFGALIVKDDTIVAVGNNQVVQSNDPTAHAEIVAIRRACQKFNTHSLKGSLIYSSCEPCPMCLSALYWAHIDAIFFASSRYDAAAVDFDDEFIYQELTKELAQRELPITQIKLPEAEEVFKKWQQKNNKMMY